LSPAQHSFDGVIGKRRIPLFRQAEGEFCPILLDMGQDARPWSKGHYGAWPTRNNGGERLRIVDQQSGRTLVASLLHGSQREHEKGAGFAVNHSYLLANVAAAGSGDANGQKHPVVDSDNNYYLVDEAHHLRAECLSAWKFLRAGPSSGRCQV
jgi:hypothetical protein